MSPIFQELRPFTWNAKSLCRLFTLHSREEAPQNGSFYTSPPKLLWAPRNLPLLKMAWEWPPDPKGPGQWSFENIPRFGPKIGTLGTPGGSHGTKFFSSEIFSLKNIGVYIEKFMALYSQKMICWWKSDISGRMEGLRYGCFCFKNKVFAKNLLNLTK